MPSGDGGGGDGSSGSDEEGNDGGVSTIPLPPTTVQSTYDVLRGLGIMGGSGQMGNDDQLQSLLSRSGMITHGQVMLVAFEQLIMISVKFYLFKKQEHAIQFWGSYFKMGRLERKRFKKSCITN